MAIIKTIDQLQNSVNLNETDGGIITQAVTNTELATLLTDYLINADFELAFNHGGMLLNRRFAYDETSAVGLAKVKSAIKYKLMSNKYNLETLLSTIGVEYNPIENYNMKEHETHNYEQEHTGHEDINHVIGETSTTDKMDIGQRQKTLNTQDNESVSAQKQTTNTNIGATGNTVIDTMGNQSETNAHSVAPYNSSSFTPTEQDALTKTGYTDNHKTTVDAQTNSSTTNTDAYTDNITHTGSVTDASTTDTHTITSTKHANDDLRTRELQDNDTGERDLTRSGNIGVTTTQQMLVSQRELANLNMVRIICELVINAIGLCNYDTDWSDNCDYNLV